MASCVSRQAYKVRLGEFKVPAKKSSDRNPRSVLQTGSTEVLIMARGKEGEVIIGGRRR